MDGFKEAMEYLVNESKPDYLEHEGKTYANKPMFVVHQKEPVADCMQLTTLTSLIDYIRSNTDKMRKKMLIHVKSPTEVLLFSRLDDNDRTREHLVCVVPDIPNFEYDKYISKEAFIIGVETKFLNDEDSGKETDKSKVIKYAGTVEAGTIASYSDDGISQKATIRDTVTSKADSILPNPVRLCPYRTFHEVEQPVSKFLFRMKNYEDSALVALFEADGGAWKNEAMQNVKEYLQKEISQMDAPNDVQFTVIS